MANFVLKNIDEFDTLQKVCKLVREEKCLYDKFVEDIKKDKNLSPELGNLMAIIEDLANNKRLPPKQFKMLKGCDKLKYKPCEVKSKHLRLYLIHEKESGQILILGGKKGDQDEDIERVKKIVKEYTQFKQ